MDRHHILLAVIAFSALLVGIIGATAQPGAGKCDKIDITSTMTDGFIAHSGWDVYATLEPDKDGSSTGTVVEFYVGCTTGDVNSCPADPYCWNDKNDVEHCEVDGDASTISRGTALPGGGTTRFVITSNGASSTIKPVLQACRLGT